MTAGASADGRVGVWQPRFWEHAIRDEADLRVHGDYVQYNAVKHGLSACPHAWPFTSFHRWEHDGFYEADWLCACGADTVKPPDFSALPIGDMESVRFRVGPAVPDACCCSVAHELAQVYSRQKMFGRAEPTGICREL